MGTPRYTITITPDEDGDWNAAMPALRGCIACGATPQEALEALLEVADVWVELAEKRGWGMPAIIPIEYGDPTMSVELQGGE